MKRYLSKALGHVPCDLFGGDGGGSSSNSATTTTTTSVDKRQVVDNGGVGVSSDSSTVNVTLTDNKAVEQAISLAKSSNETIYKGLTDILGIAKDSLDLSSKSASGIAAAYQGATDSVTGVRSVAVVGLLVVGVVAARMMAKG